METDSDKKHTNKLEIQKLILDKVLIGLLIAIFGFAANMALERYRANSTRDRFFMEKRLAAVQQVNEAFFTMHNNLISTLQKDRLNAGHYVSLNNGLNSFIASWTHNRILLSKEFIEQMERMSWLYTSLFRKDLPNMRVYRVFFYDVYEKFNFLTREEMGFARDETDQKFDFIDWTKEKADLVGEDKYLDENFEKWESTKKQME